MYTYCTYFLTPEFVYEVVRDIRVTRNMEICKHPTPLQHSFPKELTSSAILHEHPVERHHLIEVTLKSLLPVAKHKFQLSSKIVEGEPCLVELINYSMQQSAAFSESVQLMPEGLPKLTKCQCQSRNSRWHMNAIVQIPQIRCNSLLTCRCL